MMGKHRFAHFLMNGENHVESTAATITVAGMPASPHQIALLTPRRRAMEHAQLAPDVTIGQAR
jgi:hypothetical protein